jgi:hypothetical protein
MVIKDPSKFRLLATEMKEKVVQGGIATVNVMAGKARKEAVKNIQKDFINRNNFTARQVQFTPMPQGRFYAISAIHSIVGVTEKASYMARQEEGGEHTPRQGSKLAIPTDAARGGSFRNPVQRGMKVRDVRRKKMRVHGEAALRKSQYKGKGKNVPKRTKITTHGSKSSWTVARAYIAFKHKLFLPLGGNGDERNLIKITSFVPKGKGRHRKVEFDAEQIYNFEHTKTKTKARPFLMPACEKVQKDVAKIYESQMKKLGV